MLADLAWHFGDTDHGVGAVRRVLDLGDLARHELDLGRRAVAQLHLEVVGAVAVRPNAREEVLGQVDVHAGAHEVIDHLRRDLGPVDRDARAQVVRQRLGRALGLDLEASLEERLRPGTDEPRPGVLLGELLELGGDGRRVLLGARDKCLDRLLRL